MEDMTYGGSPEPMGATPKPNTTLYVGTKIIKGETMDERTFLKNVKGKTDEELQQQETQGDGYKVTYEDGYVSWSPKRVFEQCYRLLSANEISMINWPH